LLTCLPRKKIQDYAPWGANLERKETVEMVCDAGIDDWPLRRVSSQLVESSHLLADGGALAYAAGLYWESMQFARINNAPHTSAKIIRTWETVQRNGKKVKMARIAFTVIDGEKSIECEQSIPTEHLPSDLQQVGAEIDIVPNGPSCFGSIVPVLFYQTHSRP
jgi:hypothetical protein